MKRVFFLIAILVLVLPQILVSSNPSTNECCGRQLRLENLGFASASGYVNVLVSEAKQMIESNPSLVILDVRGQAEYDSGHLQNATLIPVTELAHRLGELDEQKDILVYCGSGGRSATASQTLVDNGFPNVYNMLGGITSWKSAGYLIEIVHEGDLTIGGTQTYVIENCSYIQKGNLEIKDSGALTIKDSYLFFNQTSDGQYWMEIQNNAKIVMENMTLVFDEFTIGLMARDHSVLVAKNVTAKGSPRDTQHTLSFYEYADATINMSEIGLEGDLSAFFGFSQAHIFNSTLYDARFEDHAQGEIRRTRISSLSVVGTNANVSVYDSDISTLELLPGMGSSIEVDGLEPGFFSSWNIHENVRGASNITLSATSIGNWILQVENATAVVDRSVLALTLVPLDPNSTVIVHDSIISISTGGLYEPHDSYYHIEIDSSEVTYLSLYDCVGCMLLNNVTLNLQNEHLNISASRFCMLGNFTFGNSTYTYSWLNSSVTRNYSVLLQDSIGQQISNASLLLKSNTQSVVWNGTTDDFGRADFNLTFADSNYTDTLTLEVIKDKLTSSRGIAFLSDTFVGLVLSMTGDINGDGRVDMKDVSYVARRFMCTPSDLLWDSVADINSDGKIDMKDVSIVARHFGDHYP